MRPGAVPPAPPGPDSRAAAIRVRRSLWRCRRGMKELDIVLGRFARGTLACASAGEQRAFEELLGLPDPVLAGYLLGQDMPAEPERAALVARIRAYVA